MKRGWTSRALLIALFLCAVAAVAGGVWRLGYVQGIGALVRKGEADLALSSDRVVGQLQRYRELAVLMSDHPAVAAANTGTHLAEANTLFQEVADKTSALEILFVDRTRRVLAAARSETGGLVPDQPFLGRAMNGALGMGHGANLLVAPRAVYFAAPHFAEDRSVGGAVVVAADVAEIEWDWTGTNPAVFFTDSAGEVFISNRSELIWWRRDASEDSAAARRFEARIVGGREIWQMEWEPYFPRRALHITRELPVIGMTAEALIDTAPARRIASLQAAAVAALCLAFGAMLFLATERRRALALANTKLEARVAERTSALSDANTALRREVAEREAAEAALRRAQEDLVEAGKLSALGQMSAGISHELNQPLMAIQSYAENGAAFLERDKPDRAADNLRRISDLTRRIGRIIRNLRAFARQESAPVSRVDLVKVLASAMELTATRRRDGGVTLDYSPPKGPVWVRGGEVRLCQVFVNLITNAVDAMQDSDTRALRITVREGERLRVDVADSGPGIDMPAKMFEPFYSTKSDREEGGMGLGLSISYGIVQSLGGEIRGINAAAGGAIFTVELERWSEEERAA
ncbi:sensor histidine kinase [Aliishimia ponticola]|uniref:C4-dicarboxylate transport sensor protein DctB n=1 Tax=Aliishimia ponticola TaxID=2499833 RepID=A0A4S4NGP2_9RHOB|nr:ATP-binding protein [Aliishimia ponticola]THH38824.1 sensor histidine kinase [Aliishimia ponticola]